MKIFVYDPSYLFFYPLSSFGMSESYVLYYFGGASTLELEESLHEQDDWTASSKGFLPKQP